MTTATKTKQVQLWWILAFKSQRYRVSQTKSYCSTMSMHNISPIHKFTVKVQKILGSHDQTIPLLISPTQKSLKQLLTFLNLYKHAKKSVYSIYSFLRYSQI